MHTRQPQADEEREQRRIEQRELVKASIEQLRRSDGWQAYLQARRAFHTYSALIWGATVFAGEELGHLR